MKKYIVKIVVGFTVLLASSCDKYLDELPDNRTTLDNPSKIKNIITSAYPESLPSLVAEFSSDNIDDYGSSNPNSTQFYEDIAYWKATTEVNNDDLKSAWSECYAAISNANEALKAIEKLGNPASLDAYRGEALVARAYSHFILVNLFSNHYNTQTSATDLGIPYMEEPETKLSPKYERGTVKQVYEKINADIETGLPLIDDSTYEVPKYHFNKKAAYAFAARFNLYYEQWQKAADYATLALGSAPASVLRDWQTLGKLPKEPAITIPNAYISSEEKANFLLITDASDLGLIFGAYLEGSRFSHGRNLADRETLFAAGPWGVSNTNTFWFAPRVYSATNLDKTLSYKVPYLIQYTDIVAQVGYRRTVGVMFSTDETLLTRAEANIMLKKYDQAVTDLNMWSKNYLKSGQDITQSQIETFFDSVAYSTDNAPTLKKTLQPKFTVESGTQEKLIHCVLHYRRLLTLHEGYRWFDIRRYGIEVPRYVFSQSGQRTVADKLTVNDLRRTFQLPQDVTKAGLTPNPR